LKPGLKSGSFYQVDRHFDSAGQLPDSIPARCLKQAWWSIYQRGWRWWQLSPKIGDIYQVVFLSACAKMIPGYEPREDCRYSMSTTIYYFSGSGNSLFVAKELQQKIPDSDLISMVSLLSQEKIVAGAEVIGFVFPVHCTTLPVPVRQFLTRLEFAPEAYLFAVVTQGGAWPRLVEFHLETILKEKGARLDAFYSIKMPWASPVGLMPVYIPGFIEYPKPEKKIVKMQSDALKKLDVVRDVILAQDRMPTDDFPRAIDSSFKHVVCKLMGPAINGLENSHIDFYADEDCTGCGICETVCSSQKIKMVDGTPVWQNEVQCHFCYACFSFCPAQSILVRNIYTKKDERYFNPNITSAEIALQKNGG
jgi:ferredoxin